MTTQEIINHFNMKSLPDEGGYYVETYRCCGKIANLPDRYVGPRNFSTAILYLITPSNFSKLHRVKTDEIFHFYLGDPVEMLKIDDKGKHEIEILGTDIFNNQKPQIIVLKNTWQGTKLLPHGKFALLGCTVAPGFEFADYQSADKQKLINQFPNIKDLIEKFV